MSRQNFVEGGLFSHLIYLRQIFIRFHSNFYMDLRQATKKTGQKKKVARRRATFSLFWGKGRKGIELGPPYPVYLVTIHFSCFGRDGIAAGNLLSVPCSFAGQGQVKFWAVLLLQAVKHAVLLRISAKASVSAVLFFGPHLQTRYRIPFFIDHLNLNALVRLFSKLFKRRVFPDKLITAVNLFQVVKVNESFLNFVATITQNKPQ